MGVDLDTLRPQPAVEGYTTPGGYSYRAVKPIALAKVMSIAQVSEESAIHPTLDPCSSDGRWRYFPDCSL
jgi:dihydropyrimidine dehydrogenase (NADP+)